MDELDALRECLKNQARQIEVMQVDLDLAKDALQRFMDIAVKQDELLEKLENKFEKL